MSQPHFPLNVGQRVLPSTTMAFLQTRKTVRLLASDVTTFLYALFRMALHVVTTSGDLFQLYSGSRSPEAGRLSLPWSKFDERSHLLYQLRSNRSLPDVQCIQNQVGPIEELVLPRLILYASFSTCCQLLLYCLPSLSRGHRWKGTTASFCDSASIPMQVRFPRIASPGFLRCFFSEEAPQAGDHEDHVEMEAPDPQLCPAISAFWWTATVSILLGSCLASSGDEVRPETKTWVYGPIAPVACHAIPPLSTDRTS